MGGWGSGSWHRYETKSTVDESITISIKSIRDRLRDNWGGMLTWTWGSGRRFYVTYDVYEGRSGRIVELYYSLRSGPITLGVELDMTPTQFGGQRYWFTCPIAVGDNRCGRRCDKLHIPPGARYFGCRQCYNLTYRSCQESHQMERLFAGIGIMERRVSNMLGRQS